jgi:hypothetical protein
MDIYALHGIEGLFGICLYILQPRDFCIAVHDVKDYRSVKLTTNILPVFESDKTQSLPLTQRVETGGVTIRHGVKFCVVRVSIYCCKTNAATRNSDLIVQQVICLQFLQYKEVCVWIVIKLR